MHLQLAEQGITIRPTGEEAMPALLKLYQQCEDFLALGPDPRASENMVRRDLASMRAEGSQFHGIYDETGQLLGVLDVIERGYQGRADCAYIELLMLRQSARGQGLGAAVVEALAQYLLALGVRQIEADVQVNNPAGQRFWRSIGFAIVGEPVLQADTTITYPLRKHLTK